MGQYIFMRHRLSTFWVFASGLLAAQVIASLQVYLNNLAMHRKLAAIALSGYQHLPNAKLMTMLRTWSSALAGGLFFTLSIGVGITLTTLAAVWIWETMSSRNKPVMGVLLLLWLAVLAGVNTKGFAPIPSAYFLCIPCVVIFAYQWTQRHGPVHRTGLTVGSHLACLVVLALIWSTQASNGMFVVIRDNLLLTNPVGMQVNDFYYRYTHFSAEAITSLQQKMFKTYRLSVTDGLPDSNGLERVLSDRGYLLLVNGGREDFRIDRAGEQLVFLTGNGTTVCETPARDFWSDPQQTLNTVSKKTDRNIFFRRTIFYALMIAFPISLYLILHTLCYAVTSLFLSQKKASLLSTFICFVVGAALIIPVQMGRERDIATERLPALLTSENWRDQVAALKTITRRKLEIYRVAPCRHLLESPHVPVQYWLAQALGKSRQAETYQDLLRLLQSSHPNVVCQAVYSIGRRGDARAVKKLLHMVDTSDHWYVLRYTYNALRNLGWKHTRST